MKEETGRVFLLNEVDFGPDYFHMPSHRHYPSLFAWDSGFHSVAMLHLDEEKSKRELSTLFDQVAADGHVPHEVIFPAEATGKKPLSDLMRWFGRWGYDSRGASHMADPPIYVFAAQLIFERTRDGDWLRRVFPRICRCLDYLLDERDLFGDGLVSILHPFESGTDMSPQFFAALGVDPARRSHSIKAALQTVRLFQLCNRAGWDPARLKSLNRFVFEDLTFICITIRALKSAAALAREVGDERSFGSYDSRAALMSETIESEFYDEETGCYFPRWDPFEKKTSRVKTAASLMPLFCGISQSDRAGRLVNEHLLDETEFWTGFPVTFNPLDELGRMRGWVDRKLWSGHCTWMNFNWMLAIGLAEHGFGQAAVRLTEASASMIGESGFFEYYDCRNGEGRRIADFTWPGLVLDMIARYRPDLTS